MEYQKLYTLTVGREMETYKKSNGEQTAKKVANSVQNPNAIYRVVKIEAPSGNPMYTLANVSKKNDIFDMNFKTIQDAEIFAIANKFNMEKII